MTDGDLAYCLSYDGGLADGNDVSVEIVALKKLNFVYMLVNSESYALGGQDILIMKIRALTGEIAVVRALVGVDVDQAGGLAINFLQDLLSISVSTGSDFGATNAFGYGVIILDTRMMDLVSIGLLDCDDTTNPYGIAFDKYDNVYSVATSQSAAFTRSALIDSSITKWDRLGSLVWNQVFGDVEEDRLTSIQHFVDSVFVCGRSDSPLITMVANSINGVILHMRSDTGALIKAFSFGDTARYDTFYQIKLDSTGLLYLAATTSSDTFTFNDGSLTAAFFRIPTSVSSTTCLI